MATVLKTSSCKFDFSDWKMENIAKLFAGCGCVMALTRGGRVLQKVDDPALAARMEYWTRIRDISISQWCEALAVGLVSDGTCMVAKRPLRRACENFGLNFDRINDWIKSLKGIVQVAVSDAIFALDSQGNVHHMPLTKADDYAHVASWKGIRRICVGSQCSVFGITQEGRILCAGHNCTAGPRGDMTEKLSQVTGAKDLCALGSECEQILVLLEDGSLCEPLACQSSLPPMAGGESVVANFGLAAILCQENKLEFATYFCPDVQELDKLKSVPVRSAAVGTCGIYKPFAVVLED